MSAAPVPLPPVRCPVLLVEDDAADAALTRHACPWAATVGSLAAADAIDWTPEVIFADLGLPDSGPRGTVAALRSRFPSAGICVLSGSLDTAGAVESAMLAGADMALPKPLSPEQAPAVLVQMQLRSAERGRLIEAHAQMRRMDAARDEKIAAIEARGRTTAPEAAVGGLRALFRRGAYGKPKRG